MLFCFSLTNLQAGPPRIIKSKQKYNGLNGAGAWFIIAGGSLAVGGITKAIGSGRNIPDVADYKDPNDYKNAIDRYDNLQRNCNTTFAASIGVAGLCFVFAGADMYFAAKNLKLNDQTTLRIKSDKNGVGLCLNFK